jgi:hypothetical protein
MNHRSKFKNLNMHLPKYKSNKEKKKQQKQENPTTQPKQQQQRQQSSKQHTRGSRKAHRDEIKMTNISFL